MIIHSLVIDTNHIGVIRGTMDPTNEDGPEGSVSMREHRRGQHARGLEPHTYWRGSATRG